MTCQSCKAARCGGCDHSCHASAKGRWRKPDLSKQEYDAAKGILAASILVGNGPGRQGAGGVSATRAAAVVNAGRDARDALHPDTLKRRVMALMPERDPQLWRRVQAARKQR